MKQENQDKILYKGDWYLTVYKEFCFNTNLSRDARFLLIILKSFTNDKNKEVFPSREYLCEILGCSDKSLTKYINELSEFGYLEVKKERRTEGTYKPNIYTITEKNSNKKNLRMDKDTLPTNTLKANVGNNNNQYINKERRSFSNRSNITDSIPMITNEEGFL